MKQIIIIAIICIVSVVLWPLAFLAALFLVTAIYVRFFSMGHVTWSLSGKLWNVSPRVDFLLVLGFCTLTVVGLALWEATIPGFKEVRQDIREWMEDNKRRAEERESSHK